MTVPCSMLIAVLESLIDFVTYSLIYLEESRRRRNTNTTNKRQVSRYEKLWEFHKLPPILQWVLIPQTPIHAVFFKLYLYPNLWSDKWKITNFLHRLTSGFDLRT